jgi:PAS domain S-box-containing protein
MVTTAAPNDSAVHEADPRFCALMDALPALAFVTDLRGLTHFTNARFQAYSGLSAAALLRDGWQQVLHPDDRDAARGDWSRSARTGRAHEAQYRFRRHDAEYRRHLCRVVPVRSATGEIVEWLSTCVDAEDGERANATRALLASIVSASDDAIISKSLDGIVLSWNAAAERLFGYDPAEAVGQPITLIIPPERLAEEESILARLRRGERVDHFETVRVSKTGRRIDLSLTISPILDASGRVVGASKVARDITDRKRRDQLLCDREERYELVLAGSGAAIWDWDVPGERVVYSSRWKELRGLSDDEISDSVDEWRNTIHPDDVERVMAALQAHFDGQTTVFAEEYRVRHKDGHWLWISDRGIAKRNDAGEVVRMAGSETDITERRHAEAELRETESQYRELVESANSVIIRWRCDGTLTFANEFAEALFGYDTDELVGRDVRVLVPRQDSTGTDLTSLVSDIVAHPARYRHNVNENISREGRRIWMLWTNRPIFDERGNVVEILAIGSDITKLKQAEDALRDADRRKDEFLAVLGHELRNPLAPLSTGLELLQYAEENPELLESVRTMMHRQLAHLVRLVDDLVDLSRISRGVIGLRREPLSLHVVVAAAVEFAKPLITEWCHELIQTHADEPLPLNGDFERLTQVIANLLGNAAKYTQPGGTIWLRTQVRGREALVRIKDTGLGIPPERLEGIFDMFSQVPEHRAHVSAGGLGIGLALSRELIALHGGSIEAHSEGLGRGSEFVVRLHLDEATMEHERGEGPSSRVDAAPRRLLIVDDNVDAAHSLRMLLDLEGHDVRAVHDGPSALEAMERFCPEIVLIDIGLPKMDGYDVARRIRARAGGRDVLLVALTGWGQQKDRQRAQEAGFDRHLTKPADAASLAELMAVPPSPGSPPVAGRG